MFGDHAEWDYGYVLADRLLRAKGPYERQAIEIAHDVLAAALLRTRRQEVVLSGLWHAAAMAAVAYFYADRVSPEAAERGVLDIGRRMAAQVKNEIERIGQMTGEAPKPKPPPRTAPPPDSQWVWYPERNSEMLDLSEKQGISNKDLAKKFGISHTRVSEILKKEKTKRKREQWLAAHSNPEPPEMIDPNWVNLPDDTPIEEVGLSFRAYNCCNNEGFKTVGEIRRKSDRDLLRIPNFGRRSLNELRGLGQVYPSSRVELPDDCPLDEVDLTTRTRTFLRAHGLTTVGEVRRLSDGEILRSRNVGRMTLNELRGFGPGAEEAAA